MHFPASPPMKRLGGGPPASRREVASMEEGASLLEQGEEATPLLHIKKYEDGEPDIGGRPSTKDQCRNRRAPAIILGFECLESLGFFGMSTNLVIYLSSIMHESNSSIATSITTWTGTSFLSPFLGALVADSYCGSYWMILVSSLVDLFGMVLVTLSASFPSPTAPKKIILYSGLYLVAFGSGGIKSSLLPLGADQFGDEDPKERERKASFFNWFYFCLNVGALTSSTIVVWIQENVGWVPGFGITTLCMAVAVGAFVCGTNTYKLQRPRGSPIKRAFQVVVASLVKRNSDLPSDSSLLHEESTEVPGEQRLEHTDDFRFLDKAAVVLDSDAKDGNLRPWRLCTVTQVEELKILLRLLPIWLTNTAYSVAYAQMYTTFVEQAKATDTAVASFRVPPASLAAFEVLCVMLWVLAYDMAIAPAARACTRAGRGLSQLQRMGVGYLLMALAMAAAALVEVRRLAGARSGRPIRIAWLLPQFFLVGGSEVFTFVGQLEFFYGEAPCNMRNLCTSFSMLAIALGNFLSSAVVAGVAAVTATAGGSPGWIPDDLDEGHLDYFFWAMAGLCVVNLLAFYACARRYRPKRTVMVADQHTG